MSAVAGDGSSRPGSFLTAEWRHLVMLNYEVDPPLLQPRLPAGTALESWLGRTFVSLVGFRFLRTRVRGIAIPWHTRFEEVNLRFYVRRYAPGGEERRGVVFLREIVPRRAIAWVARTVYHERYAAMPMRHRLDHEADPHQTEQGAAPGRVTYEWHHRGHWERLEAVARGSAALPPPGSEAELVTEHYWGYAAQPDGGTIEYRVEHPQWRVWRAESPLLECDAAALYGPELAEPLQRPPFSAFVAEGSPVVVRRGARIA